MPSQRQGDLFNSERRDGGRPSWRIDTGRLSLALVGLMCVLPFVSGYHPFPIFHFYQEWIALFVGVCALGLLAGRRFGLDPKAPPLVIVPVALAALVLLQTALQMVTFSGYALAAVLYLLWAALLMVLGQHLRERVGFQRVVRTLSLFLLVGGELNALIGLLQYFGVEGLLGLPIIGTVQSRIPGNIAQSNHYANYISLGLIALGWLYARCDWGRWRTAGLALPLVVVLALSGSRAAAVYWVVLVGVTAIVGRRLLEWRRLQIYTVAILVAYALANGAIRIPWTAPRAGGVSTGASAEGASTSAASGGARLFQTSTDEGRLLIWKNTSRIISSAPILGVGYGQLAWEFFVRGPDFRTPSLTGLYDNAHNIFIQIAVELGLVGFLVLVLPMLVWLNSLRRAALPLEWWWGAMLLTVEGVHSLLEFPLWYAYFLGLTAFLLGFMDVRSYRVELRRAGRAAIAAALVMGAILLVQTAVAYRHLEQVFAARPRLNSPSDMSWSNRSRYAERLQEELRRTAESPLLRPYALVLNAMFIEPNGKQVDAERRLIEPAMRFMPIPELVQSEIILLARAGDWDGAKRLIDCSIWAFPDTFEVFEKELQTVAAKDPERLGLLPALGREAYARYQQRSR